MLEPRNDTAFFCPVQGKYVFWEAKDVFNPTALVRNGQIHLLYRAEDFDGQYKGTSRVGLAVSSDGVTFSRSPVPIFFPDNDGFLDFEWEGGCEDPRIVQDEQGMYFMFYTGYNGTLARLMVTSSPDLKKWTKHGSVFKNAYDGRFIEQWSKSGSVVTKVVNETYQVATQINGSYYMYWGESDIFIATSPDLINWTPVLDGEEEDAELFSVFGPRAGKFDSWLVEPGPQAIVREDGILFIYNSKNKGANGGDPELPYGNYAAGQVLLDRNDPKQVLKRSENYFFKPEEDYEIVGQVNNVVFLEGLVYFQGRFHLYYGTADSKIAVATSESPIPFLK